MAPYLGALVDIKGGGTPDRKDARYWGGNVPWATVKDFKSTELVETQETITELGVKNSATNVIPAGTIVVPTRMAVGKAAITTVDMAINQDLKALIIKDRKSVDQQYLLRFLLAKARVLEGMSKGATVKGITLDVLRELEMPLPSLKKQKRIATILDKADAIRRKRQQVIQLADQFLRAVFLDMFGDPVTNPQRLNEKRIDSFCGIVRGSSPRPKGDPRYYDGPVPRLMVKDLTRDGWLVTPRIDTLTIEGAKKSRPIEAGTVVMAVSGNVGLTSILAVDACIHDGFIAFNKLDKTEVLPEFLLFTMTFLKSTHSAREAGAIFKNLTTHQIKEMLIPIPGIPEQNQFVSAYHKQMETVSQLENARRNTDELFNSLSNSAFVGEL